MKRNVPFHYGKRGNKSPSTHLSFLVFLQRQPLPSIRMDDAARFAWRCTKDSSWTVLIQLILRFCDRDPFGWKIIPRSFEIGGDKAERSKRISINNIATELTASWETTDACIRSMKIAFQSLSCYPTGAYLYNSAFRMKGCLSDFLVFILASLRSRWICFAEVF